MHPGNAYQVRKVLAVGVSVRRKVYENTSAGLKQPFALRKDRLRVRQMLESIVHYHSVEEGRPERAWVPLKEVSPNLIQAVIAAEDNRFMEHHGFDRVELERMWNAHRKDGKKIRGCSTISQQVAKNVFTFGTHTWARKALEAYWTVLIERIWGKRRIMEVYLNVAETGTGLYGMEAAAQHYFGRKAKDVDRKQACAIAACLPAPLERTPDNTVGFLGRRQRQIYNLIPKLDYPEWAR